MEARGVCRERRDGDATAPKFYLCQQPEAAQKTNTDKFGGLDKKEYAEDQFFSPLFLHVGVNSNGARRPRAAEHVATPSASVVRSKERNGIHNRSGVQVY